MAGHHDVAITISDDDDDNAKVDVADKSTMSQSSASGAKQFHPVPVNLPTPGYKTWVPPAVQGNSFVQPVKQIVLSQPNLDSSLKARPPKKRYTELPLLTQQLNAPPLHKVQHTMYQSKSDGHLQNEPIDLTKPVEVKPKSSIWDRIGGVEVQEVVPKPNLPVDPRTSTVPLMSGTAPSAAGLSPANSNMKSYSNQTFKTNLSPVNSNVNSFGSQPYKTQLTVPSVRSSTGSYQGILCDTLCQPLVPQHGTMFYPPQGAYYPQIVSDNYSTVMMHPVPQSQAQVMPQQPSIVVNAQQLSVVVNSGPDGQSTVAPPQQGLNQHQQNKPVCDKSEDRKKSLESTSALTQFQHIPYPTSSVETQISRNNHALVRRVQQGTLQEKQKQQITTKSVSGEYDTTQCTQVSSDVSRSRVDTAVETREHVLEMVENRKSCNKPNRQLSSDSITGSASRVSTPDSVIIESVEGPKVNLNHQQIGSRYDVQFQEVSVPVCQDHKQEEESNGCNLTILETFSLRDCPGQIVPPVPASSEASPPSAAQPDTSSGSPENGDLETSVSDLVNTTPLVLESFSLQSQGTCEDIKPADACRLDYLSKKAFYQCGMGPCVFNTVSPYEFRVHLVNVHFEADAFVCVHCGHVARTSEALIQHMNDHVKDELDRSAIECSYPHCTFQTFKPDDLIRHIHLLHYEGDRHVCCKCDKSFENALDLIMHMRSNFLSVVKCPHCSAKDVTKRNVIVHMNKSHPDKVKLVTVCRYIVCRARAVTNWPECSSKNQDQPTGNQASAPTPKKRYSKSFSLEDLGSPEMPNITDDCYPKASEDPVLLNTVLTPSSPMVNMSLNTRMGKEYIPIMSVKVASSGIEVEKIKSKAEGMFNNPANSNTSPEGSHLTSLPSSSGTDQLLTKVKTEPEDKGYDRAIKQEPEENIVKQEPVEFDKSTMQTFASGHTGVPQLKNLFLSPTSVSKERKRKLQKVNVCNKCDFYTSSNGAIYKHLHVVHKIDDMFQCSECLRFVCQEEVIEHHTTYHPTADENYVPTSMTHGFSIKYMQKSVYKLQMKDRNIAKELRDAAKSMNSVETVTTSLIERFSGAKEGEVVKLSSLETNALNEMLRNKNQTASVAPASTDPEPVAKTAKLSRRKSRSKLSMPRKKRKRNQSGDNQESSETSQVKKRKSLQEPEDNQPTESNQERDKDDKKATGNVDEEGPETPEDSPEQPEDDVITENTLTASVNTPHSAESSPEAAMDFDEYPELSDSSPPVVGDCPQTTEYTEQNNFSPHKKLKQAIDTSQMDNSAGGPVRSLSASQLSTHCSENNSETAEDKNLDRQNEAAHESKQSFSESPVKETTPKIMYPKKSLKTSSSKKKSPNNRKSVGKTLQSKLTTDKTDVKDSKLKETHKEKLDGDTSELANNRTPVKETEVKIKSSPKDNVKLEPFTGPDLTFSQVNFDDPTYEFRCKYCTYRRGTLDKFLHHLYYHFHYRPYCCGHCSFKGFSHNRILTHIRTDHPKECNPIVKRVENPNSEARCQKVAIICFIPKHIEDVSLRIRLEKKKEKAALKRALKKEKKENDAKIKKELKDKLKKPQKVKTIVKKEAGKVKTLKKSQEGSYLCPYCRTNRPMRTWTTLVIEVCYHIHYKPFTCSYCNELESASTLCVQRHIEKHHPKKEMVIKEQRDPKKEIRLKQLLQRSVDISKKHRQELKMKELKTREKKLKQKKKKEAALTRVKSETIHDKPVKQENKGKGATSPEGQTLSPQDLTVKKSHQLFREAQDDYGVSVYECLKCDYTIRNLKSMYTHSYKHQPKIFKCAYCDFKSYPRSNVLWHQRKVHSHIKASVINLAETVLS